MGFGAGSGGGISPATVDATGNINIPDGKFYQGNGENLIGYNSGSVAIMLSPSRNVWFGGGNIILNNSGRCDFSATNTAGGTTGAQTINKPSGTVNFAAAATSLVVTNSLVTANSIILCTIMTNDSTAILKNVTPASGSFTIRLNAAATAETRVGFLVINS